MHQEILMRKLKGSPIYSSSSLKNKKQITERKSQIASMNISSSQLFISDIHLSESQPIVSDLFFKTIKKASKEVCSIYILGDLFEVYLGDDDPSQLVRKVRKIFKEITDNGVPIFISLGNKDFLLGEDFIRRSGAVLLDDIHIIEQEGERILLTHGDLLCTNDKSYQVFRKIVRNDSMQKIFLKLPLTMRSQIASKAMNHTKQSVNRKKAEIMDVNIAIVEKIMLQKKITRIIHGHTHRPKIHRFSLGGFTRSRVVLGDWNTPENAKIYVASGLEKKLINACDYIR